MWHIWKIGCETTAWKTRMLRHIWSLSFRHVSFCRRESVRTATTTRTRCSTCARACRLVRWWRFSTCTRRWTTSRSACRWASFGGCRSASRGACSTRPASRRISALNSSNSTPLSSWIRSHQPASRSSSSHLTSHSRQSLCHRRSVSRSSGESDRRYQIGISFLFCFLVNR